MDKNKHDETKLPKWAQERLREARDGAGWVRFTAPRYMVVKFPDAIVLRITPPIEPINLVAGDEMAIERREIDRALAEALGFIQPDRPAPRDMPAP